ncbi:hypothetical protein LTR36_004724 [Oleoguttula mirabilis]|uniref:F-box domain-containing protein n=1 Tax=Oleoguttula mirabilis TaxID=1507867 RepID=A0AAV9JHI7_9PEZI|nr:hypothetical protein LTR36_004724 [Oleoguttula mirabilis]
MNDMVSSLAVSDPPITTETELVQENARLRAELDHYRHLAATSSASATAVSVHSGDAPPQVTASRFMDLPKELRLDIYEYLLTPGTITLRYPKASIRQHDPRYKAIPAPLHAETQLFLVSKTVKEEAVPLYLASNLFVWHPINIFGDSESRGNRLFGSTEIYGRLANLHLRRLSLALDCRDVDTHGCAMDIVHGRGFGVETSAWAPEFAAREDIQQQREDYCPWQMWNAAEYHWCDVCGCMAGSRKLEYLHVGLRYCYCPAGCCRMVKEAKAAIESCGGWRRPLKVLEFSGVRDEGEKAMLKGLEEEAPSGHKWKVRFE